MYRLRLGNLELGKSITRKAQALLYGRSAEKRQMVPSGWNPVRKVYCVVKPRGLLNYGPGPGKPPWIWAGGFVIMCTFAVKAIRQASRNGQRAQTPTRHRCRLGLLASAKMDPCLNIDPQSFGHDKKLAPLRAERISVLQWRLAASPRPVSESDRMCSRQIGAV